MAKDLNILLDTPILGEIDAWAEAEQPPRSSPFLSNVLLRTTDDRIKLCQRPGTSKVNSSSQIGSGAAVQCEVQTTTTTAPTISSITRSGTTATVTTSSAHFLGTGATVVIRAAVETPYNGTFIITVTGSTTFTYVMVSDPGGSATGTPTMTARQVYVVAVSNGRIYSSPDAGVTFTIRGAAGDLSPNGRVGGTAGRGVCIFSDGGSVPKVLTLSTMVVSSLTATAGSIPTNTNLITIWRDRLVLGGPDHNYAMSRSGCYTDFNYGGSDPARAFASNSAASTIPGGIGDPLLSLMPFNDQQLLIGGDRRTWVLQGDPGAGGSARMVDGDNGVRGPGGWCIADGILYFISSQGLCRWNGSIVEPVSQDKRPSFFQSLNPATMRVQLAFDRDRAGLWIFATLEASSTSTHQFYDLRLSAFCRQSFPNGHGPMAVVVYDGDTPTDRAIFLGGRDGYLRKVNDTTVGSDDGTAITSAGILGPHIPYGEGQRGKCLSADVVLATLANTAVEVELDSGESAEDVVTNAPATTSIVSVTSGSGGRQDTAALRVCANAFAVSVGNSTVSKTWELEHIQLRFQPGGMIR